MNQFYLTIDLLRERLSNNVNVNTVIVAKKGDEDLYKKLQPDLNLLGGEAPNFDPNDMKMFNEMMNKFGSNEKKECLLLPPQRKITSSTKPLRKKAAKKLDP